jgi:hypothetical protein
MTYCYPVSSRQVFVDSQVPNDGETSVLEAGNVCNKTNNVKSSLLELGEA